MSTANWARSLNRSLDTTLDLSSATTNRETEWDGGGQRKKSIAGDATISSSNPYKRRALLPRKSTEKGKSADTFFDAFEEEESILSISPARSYGNRNRILGGVHDGNNSSTDAPVRSSGRRSPSPSSSRSVSPNRNPWYPPGRRPSPDRCLPAEYGDGDEPTIKKATESAYVLHPTYRHMFEGTEHGTSPTTTQRGFGDGRKAGESAGRREATSAASIDSTNERAPPTHRNRVSTGDIPKVTGRRDPRGSQTLSSPRHPKDDNLTNVPSKTKFSRNVRYQGGEKGKRIANRSGGATGDHKRENVAAMRRRVRSLQDVGEGRQSGKTPASRHHEASSMIDRRANSESQSSTLFTGHEEQILALTRHGNILFSAAADGTAKVSPVVLAVFG